jgi:hypothetical protein
MTRIPLLGPVEIAARNLYFSRSIVCPKCGMHAVLQGSETLTTWEGAKSTSEPHHTFDYVWPTGWTTARALSYDSYFGDIEWETGKEEQVDMVASSMPHGEVVPSEHLIHRIGGEICCLWKVEPQPRPLAATVYDLLASLGIAAPTVLMKKYYVHAETHVLRASSASTEMSKEIAVEILVQAMEDQRSSKEE